jgi:hypothetical protein
MLRLSASETMIVGGGRSEHESKEKDACRVVVLCRCPPFAACSNMQRLMDSRGTAN